MRKSDDKVPKAVTGNRQWRGIGYFDQAGFVKSFLKIPEDRQQEFVEIIKEWAAKTIHRYGGKIRSFGGDAYLFDISLLDGESKQSLARRLVDSLWFLSESVPTLNQAILSAGFSPVSFRFGGHCGIVNEVSLLDLGANVTTIIGQSVNITQRIQSVAYTDTVFVSEDVRDLVLEHYECRRTSIDQVKDVSMGTSLFRIVGQYHSDSATTQSSISNRKIS